METIKNLFRIGNGPSSSHTIAPGVAAAMVKQKNPNAAHFNVHLYGSLASTGIGHMTDKSIEKSLKPIQPKIFWHPDENLPEHPNGMRFEVLDDQNNILDEWIGYSIGGGAIREHGVIQKEPCVYEHGNFSKIMQTCASQGISLWEYVEIRESSTIWDFLDTVSETMFTAINRGLEAEGVLPGGLGVARKANVIWRKSYLTGENFLQRGKLPAYALAVAEENAAGNRIVTAPTCGAGGVLPAVLRYVSEQIPTTEIQILRAIATAGLIGNLIKHNASISGAEVGCQGEIGTACAMAAGAAVQLLGGSIRQIEYAAEMGLEHHLGLTCDPIGGLVQIPCIERNAFAANRALDCARYAIFSDGSHLVSFDEVVQVMKQTGHDLPSLYRETSCGGLAKMVKQGKY
ncbi:MAG: L-serine ammonia-lyase [Anaerolineaceae bacterium]|nr:L-serine ammonia-lyase [Anaerolineaceae bacterium]